MSKYDFIKQGNLLFWHTAIAINWFTSPHYWWVLWVIAGWGISLLMTAIEKSIKY